MCSERKAHLGTFLGKEIVDGRIKIFYCSVQFRTLGKEKRLVKSSYKNVNIRIELTLRPKMQGDFPGVLVLARKEMERVHLII